MAIHIHNKLPWIWKMFWVCFYYRLLLKIQAVTSWMLIISLLWYINKGRSTQKFLIIRGHKVFSIIRVKTLCQGVLIKLLFSPNLLIPQRRNKPKSSQPNPIISLIHGILLSLLCITVSFSWNWGTNFIRLCIGWKPQLVAEGYLDCLMIIWERKR